MPDISDSMARATFAVLRGLAPLPRGHGYAIRVVPSVLRTGGSQIYRVADGIRMRLDPDVKMEFEMLTGAYEKRYVRLVRLLLRPGDTVFDIGANVGYYSLIVRTLVGEMGSVHCFEPHPAIFARLQENIALNHYTNVVAHQLAVANARGTVTLYSPDAAGQNSGWSSLFLPADLGEAEWPDDPTRIEVAADTLDSLVFEQGLPMPHFIKLDVERAEVPVLEGMGRLLTSARPPAILCEEQDELTDIGLRPNEVRLRLTELGYRVCEIDWRGRPIPSTAYKPRSTHIRMYLFIRGDQERWLRA